MLFQDVVDDPELSEFVESVALDGIGWAEVYGTKGFPTKLKTIAELVKVKSLFTSVHIKSGFGGKLGHDENRLCANTALPLTTREKSYIRAKIVREFNHDGDKINCTL